MVPGRQMRKARPALFGSIAVVVLAGLFVVLRDDEQESTPETQASQTSTAPASSEPEPATTQEPRTTATPVAPPVRPAAIRIFIEGGRPVGGIKRFTVKKGDRIELVVRSDIPETVHLHGYDIERPVAPGKPAQLRFVAEITGRFELELEESGVGIGDLSVTP